MLEFLPRSILDQAREGRRAAEAAADDTDTDDEALGDALGEMAEEQSGAAGAANNALGGARSARVVKIRSVGSMCRRIPERLKDPSRSATRRRTRFGRASASTTCEERRMRAPSDGRVGAKST